MTKTEFKDWRCQFGTSNQMISILRHFIWSSNLKPDDGYGAVFIIADIDRLSIGRYGYSPVRLIPDLD